MASSIAYQFQHFENLPVRYMPTSDLAKAVAMDAIIPEIQKIEDDYDMGNIVSEVISRNQEAINLMNRSQSDDDLYPEANDYDGDDNDYLDQLHNMMDQAGDEAHDADWEDKPSFANNTPENRWRDLRHLADSTFDNSVMEEVVKNKRNNTEVDHDLQKIQERLDSYSYANVQVWSPPTDSDPEDGEDSSGDESDGSSSDEGKMNRRLQMAAGAVLIGGAAYWLIQS